MSIPQPEPVQGQTAPVDPTATMADGEWHRLHPLTPLFKGGLALIVIAGIVISSARDRLIYWFVNLFTPDEAQIDEATGDPLDWVLDNNLVLGALLAVFAIVVVLIIGFWVVWRFQQFRIGEDHVEVRKGIIFRSHRRAPLDRVQGVNLTRPFPARLIGMAKLEVVGAGTDANVPLEYLSTSRAESVRSDILRLASGARAAREAARRGDAPPAGSAREPLVGALNAGVSGLIEGVDLQDVAPESVVKIPTGRLVGSQLLNAVLLLVFLLVLFGIFMAFLVPVVLRGEGPEGNFVLLGIGLGTGLPLLFVMAAVTWAQISKSLRYSIAPTRDGVRITYGLFTTVTETIPPGRIFAVEVSQSMLWRMFGWWTIKINRMSGKSAAQQSSSSAQQFNVVLPVGTRADVERVLGLILPDLPADDMPLVWEHGILGPQTDDPYRRLQRRAWWRRPVSWKRHGFTVTSFGLILRRGILWRKLAVFPLARMQGVSASQGPIDRAQRVAWMKVHSVTGPILGEVVGIERDELMAGMQEITSRATAAASSDRSHRWGEYASESSPSVSVEWPVDPAHTVPAPAFPAAPPPPPAVPEGPRES